MSTQKTRVGFSRAKGVTGLLSRAIMFFTKAPCSHVWLLYFDEDFGCDMVMEAHTEWRLIPYLAFKRKNHIILVYTPKQPIDHGLRLGGSLLGTRYDYAGMLGNLVVIVGEWFRRKWRNPFRSRRSVFCSEGVARAMIAAGYPGLPGSVHEVRPEMILKLFQLDGSKEWQPEST